MQNNLLKEHEVGVFALGGLGEVGKNMYCIEYQDEILVIDSGILFPDSSLLGIDYVINDYTYLQENEHKIKALIISHGHEDHIGAIPYLLRQVKIPKIYANGIAIGLIKNKMQEHRGLRANVVEFQEYETLVLGKMSVSFYRTNHSIPDSFGVVIHTPEGVIVHSGDNKDIIMETTKDWKNVRYIQAMEKNDSVKAYDTLITSHDFWDQFSEPPTSKHK